MKQFEIYIKTGLVFLVVLLSVAVAGGTNQALAVLVKIWDFPFKI